MFNNVYKGKTVLVTGHTGFKGTWLCSWLIKLGANVVGYSIGLPSKPSHFEELNLESKIKHYIGDISDFELLRNICIENKPEIVFHLAAQALVRLSYTEPRETMITNIIGITNILEIARTTEFIKAAIIITSDKCYDNVEWTYGYREIDRLGGEDPYSASKGCAEIVTHSYMKSFFKSNQTFIATARAGNVIGGGDWAKDRIVPDSIKAWSENKDVEIRSPYATRPWQHVLEPLSGYLLLGSELYLQNLLVKNESFNFGPESNVNKTVEQLLNEMGTLWSSVKWHITGDQSNFKEAGLLKLCCDKAHHILEWYPTMSFEETVEFTVSWYKEFYESDLSGEKLFQLTTSQIDQYIDKAKLRKRTWTH